ncbi:hypothetical protein OS493_026017 [Desmophyllum pertusum]|uniref:Uncharacterized protein n=1 Tax=Desmophyllum pertusum TaxID=174260 RepID=A0A9W9YMJ2_9CNID|nr:hypothetical protein OS493_026017 [Desmophyllum pertusum]
MRTNHVMDNTKVQDESVPSVELSSICKIKREEVERKPSNREEDHKKELGQLVKIVEELQLWVEDGDKRNKTLEEVVAKTNEENEDLLVQISVMKNELKALEEKNDTLQKLSEKEHSEIEEELQLLVEDGDKRNKTLEEVVAKNQRRK